MSVMNSPTQTPTAFTESSEDIKGSSKYPQTPSTNQAPFITMEYRTDAEIQFHTSSDYDPPKGWPGPLFKINVEYPTKGQGLEQSTPGPLPPPMVPVDEPWMRIDFKTEPLRYANMVKAYCWEGNKSADFVVQNNHVRPWYHAPWMHASSNGREPLKGLTFERSIPSFEFARNQSSALQNWAIGFYNAPGALTFGRVWKNPNDPKWTDDLKFDRGTCVFKLLLTTAKDEEVPTMKGSPAWPAVISPQPNPAMAPPDGGKRNDFASEVRLIQVDWAVVDERSPIGWVFGTYMYNGELNEADAWDRLTAVGVMWGNDPQLTQDAFNRGERPVESWINPEAERLREALGGKRPSWGYNGRLNGPADNFVSACASCHGTAQSFDAPLVQLGTLTDNKWYPLNERLTMTWFENVKAGEPFSNRGALSADYSLQFVIGWKNYKNWLKNQNTPSNVLSVPGRRIVFKTVPDDEERNSLISHLVETARVEMPPMRAGPAMFWNPDL